MSTTRPQGPDGAPVRPGLPPGGQTRRLALSGTRGVVGRCRDFTRTALHDWNWLPARNDEQEAVAEDVLLLVSELVTNACLHAGGPSELTLHCTDALLRVEVSDGSASPPVPRTPHEATRPGGHGLHIVARLALNWGTVARESDKTVWLEVRSPLAST
ncbi:ATP-binding protein [Streptacidiphilus sp. PAMC 29251]